MAGGMHRIGLNGLVWMGVSALLFASWMTLSAADGQIGLIFNPTSSSYTNLFKINPDTTVGSEIITSDEAQPLGAGIVQITTGALYLCGLRYDGRVFCESSFGVNPPNGTLFSQVVASPPAEANQFADQCVCGIERGTGVVYCWGGCYATEPTPDPFGPRFSKIALGTIFGCGITIPYNTTSTTAIGGPIMCWGSYPEMRFGQFLPPSNVWFTDISCTGDVMLSCCGIKTDSSIGCWGGSATEPVWNVQTPYMPPIGNRFVSITITYLQGCALDFSGAATCWFRYSPSSGSTQNLLSLASPGGPFTQLIALEAKGNFMTSPSVPVRVCGLIGSTGIIICNAGTSPSSIQLQSISVGDYSACGVAVGGAPACFGDPMVPGSPSPPVSLYTSDSGQALPFKQIWVGPSHSCGIVPGRPNNQPIVCWNNTIAWVAPVAGEYSFTQGDCALKAGTNELVCWRDGKPPTANMTCRQLSATDFLICCLSNVPNTPGRTSVYCWWRGASTIWTDAQSTLNTTLPNLQPASILVAHDRLYMTMNDYKTIYLVYGFQGGDYAWTELAIPPLITPGRNLAVGFVMDVTGLQNYCYIDDTNSTQCAYNFKNANTPCQATGLVQSLSCGAATCCVLLSTGFPYCWSINSGGGGPVMSGINPFAYLMPTQEPVAGLAPQGQYFSTRTGQFETCPPGTYSNAPGSVTPFWYVTYTVYCPSQFTRFGLCFDSLFTITDCFCL